MRDSRIFEKARLARDPRFDGRFFVGVRTTGIYCRPVCPATTPKRENVDYYPTAAAASEAGLRPCLRCRPECAPGTPAWAGTSTTVKRGLRLIAEGALDNGNVEDLAERLGVTSRHLRRLFGRHLGASPLAVAHTQRLHFAKRLIDETALPMGDIAVAAGFGSTRRFNDAFRRTWSRTPREFRRASGAAPAGQLTMRLPYRRPFDAARLIDFLAMRAIPGVESVAGGRYLRSAAIDGNACIIDVSDDDGALRLTVHGAETRSLLPLTQRVRALFDLDASPHDVAAVLRRDPKLKPLLKRCPGIRVPGAWDGFETTVRAILGQQISVAGATTLAGRIVARYGRPIDIDVPGIEAPPSRRFPGPERLASARLKDLGIVAARADTIRRVARAVLDGSVCFDAAQDVDEFCRSLTALKGIGDWTAQYVAMRVLKYPDAFPHSDLGLLRAFDTPQGKRLTPKALLEKSAAWRPWRAYAALLLWSADGNSGG